MESAVPTLPQAPSVPDAGGTPVGARRSAEATGLPTSAAGASRTRALMDRLGPPRWAWRLLAWVLAALTLVLLWWYTWAFVLFFVVFPLLWVVHDTFWAGARANLVFGLGVASTGWMGRDSTWLVTALVSTGFSLLMALWMRQVQAARVQAVQALADKQEALAALVAAQEELAVAERAAGISAERERWAREVHDTLAQGFVSVIALSQAAAGELEALETAGGRERGRPARERLGLIEQVARENLAEARALVAGEGPSALRGADLSQALARIVAARSEQGPQVALEIDLPVELSRPLQVAVLRTVQEALSNIARHARATTARVETRTEDGELVVLVSDDGVGTRTATEGTGLSGMRARVESLAGTLTVDPLHAPDAQGRTGTLVEARIPL